MLKIKSPEQRPAAMFTIVPDEKNKPNGKFIRQTRQKFQAWVKNMKDDLKS